MTFIWPAMLLSLSLIPLLLWAYLQLMRRRERALVALGPMGTAQNSSGDLAGRRRHLPPLLYLWGVSFLLLGGARPIMEIDLPRISGTVILAFDVSNSMTATDLEPSRIAAAKNAASTFVDSQPATIDIGVVAFSNGGLVVQTPTQDQAAVLDAVERLSPQGNTSLGQGIFTSLNAIAGEALTLDPQAIEDGTNPLKIDEYSSAVIVLLTDGENRSDPDPLEVAQLAAEAGVRVYPVGIGSEEGSVIEVDGFQVLTQLDPAALGEIAALTNGKYYQAADETALEEIYKNIDLQLSIDGEEMEVTAVLAGISLLFFLSGALLSMIWFGRIP